MTSTTMNEATACAKCGNPQIGGVWCRICGNRFVEEAPEKSNTLATAIKVGAIALFVGGWYLYHLNSTPAPAAPAVPAATTIYPSQSGVLNKVMEFAAASNTTDPTGITVFTQAAPSVVTVYKDTADKHQDLLGTGFLLENTTVATTLHALNGATSLSVCFSDNTCRKVTNLLGASQQHDVILLRIEAPPATTGKPKGVESLEAVTRQLKATIPAPGHSGSSTPTEPDLALSANSNPPLENTAVIGVGSPDARAGTVLQGIITATKGGILQTNIPVAATSSGGPLLNMQGEVVGILTSQAPTDTPAGTNIALPITWATELLSSTENHPLTAASDSPSTFGPYALKLAAHQKHNLPFTTPTGLASVQFSAALTAAAPQLHLSLLRNGRLMYDSGDDTHFQLSLKQGDYVLVVENTSTTPRDVSIQGTFAPAP